MDRLQGRCFAWGCCGRLVFCWKERRWDVLSAEVRWGRRSGTASDEEEQQNRRVVLVRPPRVVRPTEGREKEDEVYVPESIHPRSLISLRSPPVRAWSSVAAPYPPQLSAFAALLLLRMGSSTAQVKCIILPSSSALARCSPRCRMGRGIAVSRSGTTCGSAPQQGIPTRQLESQRGILCMSANVSERACPRERSSADRSDN
jgi:hypothetical protein